MDNFTGPLFAGKDLSGLDSAFKSKLENMAKAFREYVIQEKRKNWEPILISSALRSDEEQANAMMDLYRNRNKLADVYRNSVAARDFFNLIDTAILNSGGISVTSADFAKNSESDIKKAAESLVNATLKKDSESSKRTAKILLITLMQKSHYGIFSYHRNVSGGRCAVDISSHYTHIRLLREFLEDARKPWKNAFNMSEENAYGSNDKYLHIKG